MISCCVGDDEDEVALGRGGPFDDRALRVVGQELGDRAFHLAIGQRQVCQALRAEPAGTLGQLVDLAAGHAGHPGRNDGLDPSARRERRIEDAEPGRGRVVGIDQGRTQVDQLHPEADVGLVGAEPFDGLLEGEPRERRLEDRPLRNGRPRDLDRHRLDEPGHGRLVDEAHLEVELGEFGLSVAAQVLIPVAAGDLHVAVDAGDHQQLLELLGALRQRVERARLEATRDDEVPGTLGRALDEGRRLDLHEAIGVMDLADGLHHPAAEHQASLHRLAPDVEVAVLETQALVDGRIGVVDVERRRLGLGQDVDAGRLQLDRPGRQLGVLGAGQPWGDRRPRPSPRTPGGPCSPVRAPRARRPCR